MTCKPLLDHPCPTIFLISSFAPSVSLTHCAPSKLDLLLYHKCRSSWLTPLAPLITQLQIASTLNPSWPTLPFPHVIWYLLSYCRIDLLIMFQCLTSPSSVPKSVSFRELRVFILFINVPQTGGGGSIFTSILGFLTPVTLVKSFIICENVCLLIVF